MAPTKCKQCLFDITPHDGAGRPREFCSEKCRKAHGRAVIRAYVPPSPTSPEALVSEGLVTLEQARLMLAISLRGLRRQILKGAIPTLVIGSRRLIPRRVLIAFMARGLQAAGAGA